MLIGKKELTENSRTYFIAEIGSNFDGSKQRAVDLIGLAQETGADAAKFQHYTAKSLVSDVGFSKLTGNDTHQSNWKKGVYETYDAAALNSEWTAFLADECQKVGIDFLTSPYSLEFIDEVDPFVPAFKVGSGEITWHETIQYMLSKGKPILLATGASTDLEVDLLMQKLQPDHSNIVIMQCNTNYSGNNDHFKFSNLNVLREYKKRYPEALLGLSDHTPGHVTTLGAVALGAKVIEKHFTDDKTREGPDHKFALNNEEFSEMIAETRNLEDALGSDEKKVEPNEVQTRVVQRRAIRAKKDIEKGQKIIEHDVCYLRPCPENALEPFRKIDVIGKITNRPIIAGDLITLADLK